jgi:hypothetical protein
MKIDFMEEHVTIIMVRKIIQGRKQCEAGGGQGRNESQRWR